MNLKPLIASVALGVASLASHAVTDLGPVPPTASFSSTIGGAFEEEWEFSLTSLSNVTAAALNVSFSILGNSTGSITGFTVLLDDVVLLGSSSNTNVGPGVTLTTQVKAGFAQLSAGVHTLTVSGTGVTGGFATYSGYIQAVPVPEPETYAMLLAGLGVVGFLSRRRRPQD